MSAIDNSFLRLQLKFKWGATTRQDFYQLLADFVRDGVPVTDALQKIHERWVDKKDAKRLVTESLLSDMRGGKGTAKRLGQALAAFSPSMECIAIDAGEQAGNVDDGLLMAAKLTGVKATVTSTIRGQMVYPSVLILMFCGVLLGIRAQVIPILEEVLPRAMWPALPSILGNLADNVGYIVGGFIGTIVAISFIYSFSAPRWTGVIRDKFDLYVFPWSMNRYISGAIIMSCFAAMMQARIALSETLARMYENATRWERAHFNEMRDRMRRGVNDGEAIATDLFDDDVQWKLNIYGPLSSFPAALNNESDRQIKALIARISGVMNLVQTLCMMLIAGMVVIVYFSFMQITNAAKQASMSGM